MLGIGRFGSITGSMAGGVLLSMGWGFSAVIAIWRFRHHGGDLHCFHQGAASQAVTA